MSGPLGAGGGPVTRPPRPRAQKRIVVAASFSGDAHDFLRVDLGVNPSAAIIVTPTSSRGLQGLPGTMIETLYDIRRPDAYLGELDQMVRRLVALYPDMDCRVRPW